MHPDSRARCRGRCHSPMRPQQPCGSTKAVEAIAGPPRARATRQPDCKRRVPALRAAAAGPSARRHSRVAARAMLGQTRTGVAVGAVRRRRAAASIVASSSSSSDEVKSHALTRIKSQKSLESRPCVLWGGDQWANRGDSPSEACGTRHSCEYKRYQCGRNAARDSYLDGRYPSVIRPPSGLTRDVSHTVCVESLL